MSSNITSIIKDEGVLEIDFAYNYISSCLSQASDCYIIKKPNSFYKHWWNDNLSVLKADSVECFKMWQNSGKPRSGLVYDAMFKSRVRFRIAKLEQPRELLLMIMMWPKCLITVIKSCFERIGTLNLTKIKFGLLVLMVHVMSLILQIVL